MFSERTLHPFLELLRLGPVIPGGLHALLPLVDPLPLGGPVCPGLLLRLHPVPVPLGQRAGVAVRHGPGHILCSLGRVKSPCHCHQRARRIFHLVLLIYHFRVNQMSDRITVLRMNCKIFSPDIAMRLWPGKEHLQWGHTWSSLSSSW